MKSKTPTVRPLRKEDLNYFDSFGNSVRGFAIQQKEKVIGVYGIMHTNPLQAFSQIDDSLKKHPKILMKAILSFSKLMEHYDRPIYAIASDKHKNSNLVLERIGFSEIGEGLYKWSQ